MIGEYWPRHPGGLPRYQFNYGMTNVFTDSRNHDLDPIFNSVRFSTHATVGDVEVNIRESKRN